MFSQIQKFLLPSSNNFQNIQKIYIQFHKIKAFFYRKRFNETITLYLTKNKQINK